MTIPAYPLQWPAGWKRCTNRKDASFRTGGGNRTSASRSLSVADGLTRVRKELDALRIPDWNVVVSTNLALRLDGWPRSDQREPIDPGAAVYWRKGEGPMQCMAIDRYSRVADNLAAIAATLEAMRAIERHGGAEILERAFTGFVALTGPSTPDWWDVLEVRRDASRDIVLANYRRLRSDHHPDRGGDPAAFQRIQRAYEQFNEANRS